jgi:hypothetical protein
MDLVGYGLGWLFSIYWLLSVAWYVAVIVLLYKILKRLDRLPS